jgi:hypothetical protein
MFASTPAPRVLPVVLLMTVSMAMAIRIKTAGHARGSTRCDAGGSTDVSAVVGSPVGRTMVRGAVVRRTMVATVTVAVTVMVFVLLLFLVFPVDRRVRMGVSLRKELENLTCRYHLSDLRQ